MMGFTEDGQADMLKVDDRDRRLGISTAEVQLSKREDIPMPTVAAGANWWESGMTVQTILEETPFKRSAPP